LEIAMNRFASTFAALAFALGASASHANETAAAKPLPMIYVGGFQPVERASDGAGPVHALSKGIHTRKADENAAALSQALVRALQNKQAAAEVLPAGASRPHEGWLVQGVYSALDEHSRLVSLPFANTPKGPNVEVTVTIADYAKDPDAPFAVIGTDAVLKGQGSAISWNPYIIGAKFVVHEVEGRKSMDALADQIADKILENRSGLSGHDPVKQP
jgi:hypothetical protein